MRLTTVWFTWTTIHQKYLNVGSFFSQTICNYPNVIMGPECGVASQGVGRNGMLLKSPVPRKHWMLVAISYKPPIGKYMSIFK